MKTFILIASLAIVSISTHTFGQDKKASTEKANYKLASFGVRGNCGMCKSTIEKAATNLKGVRSADWDRDRKQIVVSYDASAVSEKDIHTAIAASGYDTDEVAANKKAYNNLAGCCQYDHKQKMNVKVKKVKNEGHDHGGHDHGGHQH